MISMGIPKENDLERLKTFLKVNEVDADLDTINLNNAMIVEDGNKIIGYGSYVYNGNFSINQLFIEKAYRRNKIGDGLLRAILNLMDRRTIKEVFMNTDDSNSAFMDYVGIERVEENLNTYKVKLPDFFEKPCRSTRKKV